MTENTAVFPLYPGVTQLDFTGPFEVFSRLPETRCVLAATQGGQVEGSGGLSVANVLPLARIDRCTLLCVPGGYGCIAAMEDEAYLAALRRLSASTRYITSVCTGSLLLGAAGLLRGRRAACHWAWRGLLAAFGATPDPARPEVLEVARARMDALRVERDAAVRRAAARLAALAERSRTS